MFTCDMLKRILASVCATHVYCSFAQFKSYDPNNLNPTQWDVDQARNDAWQAEQKGLNAGNALERQRQQQNAWEARRDAHILEDRLLRNQQRQAQERQNQQQVYIQGEGFNSLPTDTELRQQAIIEVTNIVSLERNKPNPGENINWSIADSASKRSSAKQMAKSHFKFIYECWCKSMHTNHAAGFDRKGKESKVKDAMAIFDLYATDYDNGWFQKERPDPANYQKWDKSRFITHYINFMLRSTYPEINAVCCVKPSAEEYRRIRSDRDKYCSSRYIESQEFRQAATKLWERERGK